MESKIDIRVNFNHSKEKYYFDFMNLSKPSDDEDLILFLGDIVDKAIKLLKLDQDYKIEGFNYEKYLPLAKQRNSALLTTSKNARTDTEDSKTKTPKQYIDSANNEMLKLFNRQNVSAQPH